MTLKKILLAAAATALSASAAQAATIGHLNNNGSSQAKAGSNLMIVAGSGEITPEDGADTYVAVSNAAYASMTPEELASSYDVLVMPWLISGAVDFDWNTRILPYLLAGGTVLWEEPNNIGEISGPGNSGLTLTSGNNYGLGSGSPDISLVAPFSDNDADGHFHIHFSIGDSTDDGLGDWDCWSSDVNGRCHGAYKDFLPGPELGGRMVVGVSDNLFHPDFNSPSEVGDRNLTVNQINWLLTGSVDGTPSDPPADPVDPPSTVPVPGALPLMGLALGALGLARRRKS